MKIGVLGLGSIGSRHARNLVAMGHEVIGYDPQIHQLPQRELAIGTSDAMVIASPTREHYHDLLDSMAAGKPTFVEKPIAATAFEWNRLSCEPHKTPKVFVGYNLRFCECVIKAREWIDDGLIGNLLWGNFTCAQLNNKPDYLRDGVILNWSHEIDLALYLLGPAEVECASARATVVNEARDIIADIILVHGNGARSTVHLDYVTQPQIRETTIVGTKGIIIIKLAGQRYVSVRDLNQNTVMHFAEKTWDDDYKTEMQAFIDRIEGKTTLGATGADGLAALRVCLDARKKAGLG